MLFLRHEFLFEHEGRELSNGDGNGGIEFFGSFDNPEDQFPEPVHVAHGILFEGRHFLSGGFSLPKVGGTRKFLDRQSEIVARFREGTEHEAEGIVEIDHPFGGIHFGKRHFSGEDFKFRAEAVKAFIEIVLREFNMVVVEENRQIEIETMRENICGISRMNMLSHIANKRG